MTRLYAETDTPVEAIARQFGIGQSSIYRLAQQHGVPLRQAAAASAADDHTPAPAGAGRSRAARAGAVSPAAASGRGSRGRAPGTGATVRATSRVERRLVRAVTTAEAAPAAGSRRWRRSLASSQGAAE